MPRKVLMVIDMLKDFLEPGGSLYCGQAARDIVPFVVEKVKEFMSQNEPVIFIMDAHEPEDAEFALSPPTAFMGPGGPSLSRNWPPWPRSIPLPLKCPKPATAAFSAPA